MNYLDIAVTAARAAAARHAAAAETHWNTYDTPMYRGRQQAACGTYVSLRQISPEPTCPACRQQQAVYAAMTF